MKYLGKNGLRVKDNKVWHEGNFDPDSKVDNSRVLTDVPANAKFTDTIYTHPSTHPASMITESTSRRFVSDAEKSKWNGYYRGNWDYVTFNVYGDADVYYPVVLTGLNMNEATMSFLEIYRAYNWKAPDTWNTPTHKGGLNLSIHYSLAGWGGQNYELQITLSQTYSKMVANVITASPDTSSIIVWLRGGDAQYQLRRQSNDVNVTVYDGVQNDLPFKNKEGTQYETIYNSTTTIEGWFNFIGIRKLLTTENNLYIGGGYRNPKNSVKIYHENNKPTPSDIGASPVGHTHDDRYYTKTEINTKLSDKVDNSRVLTNVPANAKFTDTITTINGKTGVISKADIVALGIPAQDTNTTYSEISTSEIDAGTSSTLRTISGRRVKYILDKVSTMILTAISNLTKADVGLGNVDNVKQASKTEFDAHTSNKSNPHSVTKSQVGLGNVQNYGIATQAEAEAGTSSAKYMTPLRTKQAINALQAVKSVAGKTGAVTLSKSDVGLSNVENKSSATIRGEITKTNVINALNYTPVKDGGNTPELRSGTESARPSATGSGSVYFATDTQKIYKDTAIGQWTQMGGQDLPIASKTVLGGIKVGNNLSITEDGVLSAVDSDERSTFIVKQEMFIATEGQTLFNLTKGHYQPNTNTISVYLYGGKQPNIVLNEISTSSFEINEPLKAGDVVLVEYIELSSATPYPIHGSDHLTGGYDPIPKVTTSSDGLMSKEDKTKLDTIEQGANKYTHPSTHPASMITESISRRFVSDSEKVTWNNKQDALGYTPVNKAGDTITGDIKLYATPTNTSRTLRMGDRDGSYGFDIKYNGEGAGVNNTLQVWSDNQATGSPIQVLEINQDGLFKFSKTPQVASSNISLEGHTHDNRYYTESEVDAKLSGKANSSQVLTDVPANAKFTDTITTINGKTGAISKADIVALGIPAQDTVYTHPSTHPYSMITGTPTSMEPTYTAIPSNADLNNYKTIGFYGTANSSIGNTVLNKPSGVSSFALIVAKRGGDYTNQILFQWEQENPHIWTRSYSSGWGAWKKVVFSTDLPTSLPANGGNSDTVDGKHASDFTPSSHVDDISHLPFVVGTQTTTTASWTGNAPSLKELVNGTTIRYWLPRTSASNVTLELTLADGSSTGAIPCYYSNSTRLSTHYAAGNIIVLTYVDGVTANGTARSGWYAHSQYNSTYSVITEAELDTGTATTGRLLSAQRIAYMFSKVSDMISIAISNLTKNDVGLGNVTNESKATMFTSPTFTGIPKAPTAAVGTNTTQIATTAFVQNSLSGAGLGDMLKSVYDTNNNGIVDNAEKVNGYNVNQNLRKTDTVQFAKVGVGTSTPNESVDIVGNARVRSEGSMKFGGTGANDAAFEIKYNSSTKSLDFNFLL